MRYHRHAHIPGANHLSLSRTISMTVMMRAVLWARFMMWDCCHRMIISSYQNSHLVNWFWDAVSAYVCQVEFWRLKYQCHMLTKTSSPAPEQHAALFWNCRGDISRITIVQESGNNESTAFDVEIHQNSWVWLIAGLAKWQKGEWNGWGKQGQAWRARCIPNALNSAQFEHGFAKVLTPRLQGDGYGISRHMTSDVWSKLVT